MTVTDEVHGATIRPPAGGTLRLYGPASVDCLDPVAAPPHARQIVHLFARQLLGYRAHGLRDQRSLEPVADLACDVPSTYNAGLGASQRSYVVHLRPGVLWDTSPPRPVTAADVIRGFKRLANPMVHSVASSYFRSTVRGMADFADGFASALRGGAATPARIAEYQDSNRIAGVFSLDAEALVIELVRATPDFVHMLALTGASPAPAEYDAYLPGSAELHRNLRSNGPYRVTTHRPGRGVRLEPNPVWRAAADPLRHRRVDAIEITVARGADSVDAGGLADLPWDAARPAAAPDAAPVGPLGWELDPYLVFNLADGRPAVRDRRVRAAVVAAVDKHAILEAARALDPPPGPRVANSIVPPYNDAHHDHPIGPAAYRGDPDAARALLRAADREAGLALTIAVEPGGFHTEVATLCARALAGAGIELELVPLDADGRPPREWDLMATRLAPEWHARNGRVFLQAMFETAAGANVGGFSDPVVDDLINRAVAAAIDAPPRATAAWRDVEEHVLGADVVVPLLFRPPPVPPVASGRVRGATPMPSLAYAYDLSGLWLDDDRGDSWTNAS